MDLPSYFREKNLVPKSVIHVGGIGEEIAMYTAMGFKRILILQPDPVLFEQVRGATAGKAHTLGVSVQLSQSGGYREIDGRLTACRRLDSLLVELGVHPREFNTLVVENETMTPLLTGGPESAKYLEVEVWGGQPLAGQGAVGPFINLWQRPHGRFANEIFQHFFARRYAYRNRLMLHTPPWSGQNLFGISDPLLQREAMTYEEHDPRPEASDLWQHTQLTAGDGKPPENVCFFGNFQFNTGLYTIEEQQSFRELYRPVDALREALNDARRAMMGTHRVLVAIHLRRGDYKDNDPGMFYRTPVESYKRWLEEIWDTLDTPLLYIASDDPTVVEQFARWNPHTAKDMAITIGETFYVDFWVLSQAHALAISNSSFSFAAAMLNTFPDGLHMANHFVRPLRDGTMVPFHPWHADVLLGRYDDVGKPAEEATDAYLVDLMSVMDPTRQGILLEVGCGSFGWTFQAIAKLGFKAHAIEPDPTPEFIAACKQTRTSHTVAVISEKDGEVPLYPGRGPDLNSLLPDWWGVSEHAPVQLVHSFRLETYLRTRSIEQVTCLKLDVEGAEERIIRQLQHKAFKLPAIVVFEYGGTPRKEGKGGWTPEALANTMRCFEILIECGYHTFHVIENRRAPRVVRVEKWMHLMENMFFAPDADYGNIIALLDPTPIDHHAPSAIAAPLVAPPA